MIVSDDHGYPHFGFMGSDVVRTPRIDELARGGVVFPVTYVTASLCRPSLQTLLTGMYPHEYRRAQSDLAKSEGIVLDGSEIRRFTTLPRVLGERGYASFQAGKHWEGSFEMAGFSEGTKPHIAAQKAGLMWAGGEGGFRIGRETMEPVFEFIDRHIEQPFFLWFAPMLPHDPMDPPAEFLRQYQDAGLSEIEKSYFANITRLDAAIGQLLDHLEKRGLREDTLVVFLSDNGWDPEPSKLITGGAHGKASIYELGMRTPTILSWPGVIRGGEVEEGVVSSVDIFQTLIDFAGIAPLKSRSGLSLRPRIQGEQPHPRERIVGSTQVHKHLVREHRKDALPIDPMNPLTRAFYVRDSQWHYVWVPAEDRDWLFDIRDDPQEKHEVSAEHPGVVERLRRREIRRWARAHDGRVDP